MRNRILSWVILRSVLAIGAFFALPIAGQAQDVTVLGTIYDTTVQPSRRVILGTH